MKIKWVCDRPEYHDKLYWVDYLTLHEMSFNTLAEAQDKITELKQTQQSGG